MIKVMFINNDGGGFADTVEVTDGTTVRQLFDSRVPGGNPSRYLIRVNREPAAQNYVLKNGDRLSITPTKIEGAAV